MQVFKIEQPLVAFKFVATDKGNNFDELSADVVAVGGTVEQLGDALALVRGVGVEVQLPLGFGVVYDGSVGKVMPVDVLDSQYVAVGAVSGVDLDDLVARLSKVENELGKLSKPKSEPKAKADKTSEPAAGADTAQK